MDEISTEPKHMHEQLEIKFKCSLVLTAYITQNINKTIENVENIYAKGMSNLIHFLS